MREFSSRGVAEVKRDDDGDGDGSGRGARVNGGISDTIPRARIRTPFPGECVAFPKREIAGGKRGGRGLERNILGALSKG